MSLARPLSLIKKIYILVKLRYCTDILLIFYNQLRHCSVEYIVPHYTYQVDDIAKLQIQPESGRHYIQVVVVVVVIVYTPRFSRQEQTCLRLD